MSGPYYRFDGDTLLLRVRVQPGARKTAIAGVVNGELKLRITAPASDGRANDAVRKFLAERLGTAASRVQIVRGVSSRSKTLAIGGAQYPPDCLTEDQPE